MCFVVLATMSVPECHMRIREDPSTSFLLMHNQAIRVDRQEIPGRSQGNPPDRSVSWSLIMLGCMPFAWATHCCTLRLRAEVLRDGRDPCSRNKATKWWLEIQTPALLERLYYHMGPAYRLLACGRIEKRGTAGCNPKTNGSQLPFDQPHVYFPRFCEGRSPTPQTK